MMSNSYTEDYLVGQPAIQLMQDELGWEVGGNIELRTPNIEHRSEEKLKRQTNPALQRLNPDLPVDHPSPRLRTAGAVEGAVEKRGILNDESVVAFGFAGTSFWILNGRGRRQTVPRQNPALSLAEETVVHGNIGVHGVREHLNIVNKMLAKRS